MLRCKQCGFDIVRESAVAFCPSCGYKDESCHLDPNKTALGTAIIDQHNPHQCSHVCCEHCHKANKIGQRCINYCGWCGWALIPVGLYEYGIIGPKMKDERVNELHAVLMSMAIKLTKQFPPRRH